MYLGSEGVDAVGVVNRAGLRLQLFLLSPEAIGVPGWRLGDASSYAYTCLDHENCPPRGCPTAPTVDVAVVGRSEPDHAVVERRDALSGLHWLRWTGLEVFRRKPDQNFTLAKQGDLRTSRSMPRYRFQSGYFPTVDDFADLQNVAQAKMSFLGFVTEEVPAGTFDCMHFRATIGDETLELWTSPEVTPLGIVKIRSRKEELALTSTGNDPATIPVEAPMDLVVGGVSTIANGCMSCHAIDDCHTKIEPPR